MHELTPVLSWDIIEFRLGSGWEIEMLLGVSAWFRAGLEWRVTRCTCGGMEGVVPQPLPFHYPFNYQKPIVTSHFMLKLSHYIKLLIRYLLVIKLPLQRTLHYNDASIIFQRARS